MELNKNPDQTPGTGVPLNGVVTFDTMLDGATMLTATELGASNDRYEMEAGDVLSSYYEKTFEEFLGVCKYYRDSEFELYDSHVMNGNYFATWYNLTEMVHVYWIAGEEELNIVTSTTGAESLPDKNAFVDTKKCSVSVTQLKSPKNNGMGYVVQLTDGILS